MDPLRHILLVELNDKGYASGLCKASGDWLVFDLTGAPETTLPGHILTGEFHAEPGSFFPVLNVDNGDTMTSRIFKRGLAESDARLELDWLGEPSKVEYIRAGGDDPTLYTRKVPDKPQDRGFVANPR
ncbi:MAG TPA: hypothetical protein VG796_10550 [Verrucomicrobiales bacterium]|nr:hypothetical protein [Verrucomicrobiales bacterium]